MLHEYVGGAHFNYMKIFFLRTLLFDYLFLISVVEHLPCFLFRFFVLLVSESNILVFPMVELNLRDNVFLLLFANFTKGFILIFNMKAPSSKFS